MPKYDDRALPCKKNARREARRLLSALPESTRTEGARSVCRRFCLLPLFRDAETLHMYMPTRHELDIRPLIEEAWRLGKTTAFPVVVPGPLLRIVHRLARRWEDFAPGPFGIMEPLPDKPLLPDNAFDLVVTPGLLFDRQGYRLGYGGGFYDRFFTVSKAARVALAFSEQVQASVPHCPHDVPVHMIVTENEWIYGTKTPTPCPFMTQYPTECRELTTAEGERPNA